jgi:hypothetical protein
VSIAVALAALAATAWAQQQDNARLVDESTTVPLTITGRVSLRSALELLLDAHDLTVGLADGGFVVTDRAKIDSSLSSAESRIQRDCTERIRHKLTGSTCSFDFADAPLAKVAAFFESQSGENVVLDPRGRLQGKINPRARIPGRGKNMPLGAALKELIGPLGLN